MDSLRAVAALLVVWTHASKLFVELGPAGWSWLWEGTKLIDLGRMGVVAFFGVSGFLIPNSLGARRPGAAKRFVIRRALRLFPAFLLSVPLGVATVWWLFDRPIALRDIAVNLTMLPELFGATPVMGLYWTLAYEWAFYAACLALFLAGLLHRPGVQALVLAACVAGFGAAFSAGALTRSQPLMDLGVVFLNAAALFLGAVWRQFLDGRLTMRFERLALAGALAVYGLAIPAASAVVLLVLRIDNPFFVTLPVSYGAGVALFVLMTSIGKVRWRWLAGVGLISYSLYLLHPVVIYTMVFLLRGSEIAQIVPPPVWIAMATLLSVGLAAAAFHLVERPGIALGRRFTTKSSPPPTAANSAVPPRDQPASLT